MCSTLCLAKGSSLIDSQPVITKKLDKLLESCEQRALGNVSSDALVSYQRRVVRLSSQLCGRVVCDLLIRVRPVHDIHIWHLLRNKGVEFTGTGSLLSLVVNYYSTNIQYCTSIFFSIKQALIKTVNYSMK